MKIIYNLRKTRLVRKPLTVKVYYYLCTRALCVYIYCVCTIYSMVQQLNLVLMCRILPYMQRDSHHRDSKAHFFVTCNFSEPSILNLNYTPDAKNICIWCNAFYVALTHPGCSLPNVLFLQKKNLNIP